MRIRFYRYRPRPAGPRAKGKTVIAAAALILAAIWVLILLLDAHIRPMITQLAAARVTVLATEATHKAVSARLESGSYDYDRLIDLEKDNEGRITALKTDMVTINRLKSDITQDVLKAINALGTSELGIPAGNVVNGELLNGRGPLIRVKIVPVASANAQFSNVFTAAGINQTRHQIQMNITTEISVLVPGSSAAVTVGVDVTVAETIIVGTVPDSYLQLGGESKTP